MNKEEKDKDILGAMYYFMGVLAMVSAGMLGYMISSPIKQPIVFAVGLLCFLISVGTTMARLLETW